MPSPSEIAKRLSKAQRALLTDIPTYAVESYSPARWLVSKQLATRSDTGQVLPTPLGLAVRDILKEQGNA